jgi:hypothetical protein
MIMRAARRLFRHIGPSGSLDPDLFGVLRRLENRVTSGGFERKSSSYHLVIYRSYGKIHHFL